MKIIENRTGQRGIEKYDKRAQPRRLPVGMSERNSINGRSSKRTGNGLKRYERKGRRPDAQEESGSENYRREVKRPVASFNGIAKTPECAGSGLSKDPEIHEVVVKLVSERAQKEKDGRIEGHCRP